MPASFQSIVGPGLPAIDKGADGERDETHGWAVYRSVAFVAQSVGRRRQSEELGCFGAETCRLILWQGVVAFSMLVAHSAVKHDRSMAWGDFVEAAYT